MFYKLNPIVNLETIYPAKQENFSITNETFLAWRIKASDGSSIVQNQIKPYIAHVIYDNINRNYLQWEQFKNLNCSDNRFKNYFENSIYKANEWICFDFSAIANQNITGGPSNPYNSFIQFYLDICDLELKPNFFRKTNCSDYKQLRRFIFENKMYLEFLYQETIFRPNDYEKPLENKLNSFFNYLSVNILNSDTVFFQKTVVEQENVILLSNEKKATNMYGINKIKNYNTFVTDEEFDEYYKTDKFSDHYVVYACSFEYEQHYPRYLRKYKQIQDVFGNVNGVMRFIISVLGAIYYFYSKYRFDTFLFNKLVNVNNYKELFLKQKANEMIIINKNNNCKGNGNENGKEKGENELPKNNIDHIKSNSNDDMKNEIHSLNDIDCKISDPTIINKIEFENIPAKSQDKTRKLYNFPITEGILEEQKANDNEKLSKEAQVDGVNEARVENCIENNSLSEEDKKIFIEELEKLSSHTKKKTSYLQIFLCINLCKRKDKKYSFDLKLKETYVNKINEKFDIFYYLRWLRQFKNLKKYIFKEENEPQIFKILASDAYKVSIKDYNDDFFKEDKNLKGIIGQWVKNLNNVNQTDLSKFLFNNYQILIQN